MKTGNLTKMMQKWRTGIKTSMINNNVSSESQRPTCEKKESRPNGLAVNVWHVQIRHSHDRRNRNLKGSRKFRRTSKDKAIIHQSICTTGQCDQATYVACTENLPPGQNTTVFSLIQLAYVNACSPEHVHRSHDMRARNWNMMTRSKQTCRINKGMQYSIPKYSPHTICDKSNVDNGTSRRSLVQVDMWCFYENLSQKEVRPSMRPFAQADITNDGTSRRSDVQMGMWCFYGKALMKFVHPGGFLSKRIIV